MLARRADREQNASRSARQNIPHRTDRSWENTRVNARNLLLGALWGTNPGAGRQLRPNSNNFGRIQSNLGQVLPDLARRGPKLVRPWPRVIECGNRPTNYSEHVPGGIFRGFVQIQSMLAGTSRACFHDASRAPRDHFFRIWVPRSEISNPLNSPPPRGHCKQQL